MKKYMTRPVVAVVTTAVLIGGVTPLLASASVETHSTPAKVTVGEVTTTPIANKELIASTQKAASPAAQVTASATSGLKPTSTKVVMNDEGKKTTRYNLKDLALNDPDTLQILLKQQAEHLYMVVDEIGLDTHLQTFMQDHTEEWERIYQEHYKNIWLEVRFLDDQEIVSVQAETEGDKAYIKGIVTPDVTKIVVTKPNGDTITVVPTSELTFAVSFLWNGSSKDEYATVKAYAGTKLVDSEKVKLVPQTEDDAQLLMHTYSVLDAKKSELKLRGIVKLPADKIYVTYNGVKKSAKVQKLWDDVGSFSVTLKDVTEGKEKALVEIYKGDKKLSSSSIDVQVINKTENTAKVYTLTGVAEIDAKQKKIKVSGTVAGWDKNKNKNVSLAIVAPNGQKKVVKPNAHGEFNHTFSLSGKNKSWNGDDVKLELYVDGKLVIEKEISYKTVTTKDKKHPNGNAYGYWKNQDKKGKDKDRDDEDDDDDDDDDDEDED